MLEWEHRITLDTGSDSWALVDIKTGRNLVGLKVSNRATAKQNKKLRDKIKRDYEQYYIMMMFEHAGF